MIFFFKKKPIVLTCATNMIGTKELSPVCRSNKFIPAWWSALSSSLQYPNEMAPRKTMKHCSGFIGLYTNGAIIPSWCDLVLKIGPIGTTYYAYQFSDELSEIDTHLPEQHDNALKETEFQHLKILSPWLFHCDEDMRFMFFEPTWSLYKFKTMRVLPGIVEFKHQTTTHINILISRTEQEQMITIPFLEPLVHVVPLSDRPLKIVLTDDQEIFKKTRIFSKSVSFVRRYDNIKKAITKFNDQ